MQAKRTLTAAEKNDLIDRIINKKKTAKETAIEIKEKCQKLGWSYEVRGSILTIQKHFTPGDNNGLVECDMFYYDILSLLPQTSPGSTWGTDCGGIGAYAALKTGCFTMNKSGGSKTVLKALAKL